MRQNDSDRAGTDPRTMATVALDRIDDGRLAGNGVHWTLEESEDLNVNLVHLDANAEVPSHINTAVDVVIVVLEGTGHLAVDGMVGALDVHTLAHVPKGQNGRSTPTTAASPTSPRTVAGAHSASTPTQ